MRLTLGGMLILCSAACFGEAVAGVPTDTCGAIVTVATHNQTSTLYALTLPAHSAQSTINPSVDTTPITLVLLPGGAGHVDLDGKGCARALKGNSLVRSIPLFSAMGFATALVDAPSDYQGAEGLAGFRITQDHADDLGKIITDVRTRTKGAVWLIGTSRGTLSAVNLASRSAGSGGPVPDGIVLTSALMQGQRGAKKMWVEQSVFDMPLEAIKLPLLVVGHAADACIRSPAKLMEKITARTEGVREQVVTVTGGPGLPRSSSVDACEGKAPHGFIEQEEEVAAGIARFVRGGVY